MFISLHYCLQYGFVFTILGRVLIQPSSWNFYMLLVVTILCLRFCFQLSDISSCISAIAKVWERWQRASCYIKSSFNLLITLLSICNFFHSTVQLLRLIWGTLVSWIRLKFRGSHIGSIVIFVILTPECTVENITFPFFFIIENFCDRGSCPEGRVWKWNAWWAVT